jgi:hypothetical protein
MSALLFIGNHSVTLPIQWVHNTSLPHSLCSYPPYFAAMIVFLEPKYLFMKFTASFFCIMLSIILKHINLHYHIIFTSAYCHIGSDSLISVRIFNLPKSYAV